jgi:hypothetical protein
MAEIKKGLKALKMKRADLYTLDELFRKKRKAEDK